ncbi:hypothetical protein NFI96_014348 [Prochilodus magdalenae]|nr:hypothetical protein NFI96_014348 [Prochilodus magdalenae]
MLLPHDFTVYSYAKDGSLVTDRPNMKPSPEGTLLHNRLTYGYPMTVGMPKDLDLRSVVIMDDEYWSFIAPENLVALLGSPVLVGFIAPPQAHARWLRSILFYWAVWILQALSLYPTDPAATITDIHRAVVSYMSHPVSTIGRRLHHAGLHAHRPLPRLSLTPRCNGVMPDCHGGTQNGGGSSSVTSPALVLVETPNESVCGGTVVSTEMNSLPLHVQKAWCHSTSTPTAPCAGTSCDLDVTGQLDLSASPGSNERSRLCGRTVKTPIRPVSTSVLAFGSVGSPLKFSLTSWLHITLYGVGVMDSWVNHCHYRGYVEDVDGSSAALSLCSGLRGVIHVENASLGIEPLEGSVDNEHLVYRLEDVKAEPLTCGTPHSVPHDDPASPEHSEDSHTHDITPGQPMSHLIRKKRAVMHQTHYVELLLVVDNERFNFTNRNHTAVREEMVQLANYVDSMYVPLNIRVVLVGLEIWSLMNFINTDGSAGEVLGRFTQWREKELVPRRRHDSAQLILKKGFGGTAGMAFVGTACSRSHGGGINAFSNKNVLSFASIVAHELGHNLGMNHDDGRSCRCDVSSCIMNSGATGSRNFSSCSADDFEKMVLNTGGSCLLNVPRPDEAYSAPYCGNKLVDVGEECDCGSEEASRLFKYSLSVRRTPAVSPRRVSCELERSVPMGSAANTAGSTLFFKDQEPHRTTTEQFLPGGTVCRSSTDECDLSEYCNGSSALCQSDVFKQNGHPCQQGEAYCYNGQCQHYDSQCQAIFGPKAKAAPEACFKDVNSKGDRFGNCGYQNNGFRRCESRNAMCGKLQCENVQTNVIFGIKPSIIQTPIGGTTCWGVDFLLGSDVPDPGMVNEGTKCGENKNETPQRIEFRVFLLKRSLPYCLERSQVCLNYECKRADVLNYDCDVEKKCHGHGVCNSNKNCHCDNGWAPPNCESSGYGGSIDSGPTWNDKDTSTRDGLLVFFFLILPLLALGVFVFFRRNELRRRFCRKKRSQGYEADSRPQTNNSRLPANQRGNASSIVKDGVSQQICSSLSRVGTLCSFNQHTTIDERTKPTANP